MIINLYLTFLKKCLDENKNDSFFYKHEHKKLKKFFSFNKIKFRLEPRT